MTDAEIDTLLSTIDSDLGDLSDIIVQLRALLPIIREPVKLAMKGGVINEAMAAGQLLMHIGPLKQLAENVLASAKKVRVQ